MPPLPPLRKVVGSAEQVLAATNLRRWIAYKNGSLPVQLIAQQIEIEIGDSRGYRHSESFRGTLSLTPFGEADEFYRDERARLERSIELDDAHQTATIPLSVRLWLGTGQVLTSRRWMTVLREGRYPTTLPRDLWDLVLGPWLLRAEGKDPSHTPEGHGGHGVPDGWEHRQACALMRQPPSFYRNALDSVSGGTNWHDATYMMVRVTNPPPLPTWKDEADECH